MVVRSRIVEPRNAVATAVSIRVSATLFRLSFVADLVQATCFLLTAVVSICFARHVETPLASAMVMT